MVDKRDEDEGDAANAEVTTGRTNAAQEGNSPEAVATQREVAQSTGDESAPETQSAQTVNAEQQQETQQPATPGDAPPSREVEAQSEATDGPDGDAREMKTARSGEQPTQGEEQAERQDADIQLSALEQRYVDGEVAAERKNVETERAANGVSPEASPNVSNNRARAAAR